MLTNGQCPWCKNKSFVSYVRIPCQDKILLYLDIRSADEDVYVNEKMTAIKDCNYSSNDEKATINPRAIIHSAVAHTLWHTGRQVSIRQEGGKVFGIYIFSKMSAQIYQIMHTGRQASIRQEGKRSLEYIFF